VLRLGMRLTLASGREALTRLIITACAVAIGVAVLLAVLADFHAFQTASGRLCWECTQGTAVTSPRGPAAAGAELWNYGNDIYRGKTIERLEVAPLGPNAPVPPGISRLPGPGQYDASPALAALIRSAPRDQLGARFAGQQAGTIGHAALSGPTELVIYEGARPASLTSLPGTMQVDHIATGEGKQVWTPYFRDAFAVGALAFLLPILILIGTATRLAAARREQRYAAMRLTGATSGQISVISAVDAALSALLGTLAGIAVFKLLQPALAGTAITSARYFAADVTPTAWGYFGTLVAVPAASVIASLLSLRRVRISPLGVARRTAAGPPSAWRIAPLLAGLALFVTGLHQTNQQSIGKPLFPGLILIMIGLVVGGPWLTAQAAQLFPRLAAGAPALLASRRLADDPRAAFRSIRGLVLAVFLGTTVAGLLPAVNATTATPSARALNNVLLAGFMVSPICGNSVNCTGNALGPQGIKPSQSQTALNGLRPPVGARLVLGLEGIHGAAVFPVYSLPVGSSAASGAGSGGGAGKGGAGPGGGPGGGAGSGGAGPGSGPGGGAGNGGAGGIMSCASLRQLAVLGRCAPGLDAVKAKTFSLYGDNPRDTTQPIASPSSPAAPADVSRLYLQAVLVRVSSPAVLEQVRTYLALHTAQSASGSAPRTFGEAVQAREGVANTVQRLLFVAVALTLLVAGCSLAVAAGGGLVERKRPFALLRLGGTPVSALYRVVLLEAVLPLAMATVVAAGVAYGIAVLTVSRMAPAGTPAPVLGHVYYLTMGAGLAVSLLVICLTLPLLGRITGPGSAQFE
jgi:hypothetical protein